MSTSLPPQIMLASLVCSRLCHDLVGPVGAVSNGIELIEDGDAETIEEAHMLIAKSAGQAVHRLLFFRLAFGATANATVDARMAIEAAAPLLADGKVTLDWQDSLTGAEDVRSSRAMKLALNFVLMAYDVMPRGGTIRVRTEGSAAEPSILVEGEGPMAALDDNACQALERGCRQDDEAAALLDARAVQPYFAGWLAASLDLGVRVSATGPQRVCIEAVPG